MPRLSRDEIESREKIKLRKKAAEQHKYRALTDAMYDGPHGWIRCRVLTVRRKDYGWCWAPMLDSVVILKQGHKLSYSVPAYRVVPLDFWQEGRQTSDNYVWVP